MSKKIVYLILILIAAAALTALWVSRQEDQSGGNVQVGAGAAVTSTTANTGASFVAADLPLETGSRLSYFTNAPGASIKVNFDLSGPWDFLNGPTQATIGVSTMSSDSAPSNSQFPDAQVASMASPEKISGTSAQAAANAYRSSASSSVYLGSAPSSRSSSFFAIPNTTSVAPAQSAAGSASLTEYIYESKDDSAWLSYGRVTPTGSVVIYSAPSKALVFPLSTGKQWQDVYNEVQDGKTTKVTAVNTVLAYNKLTVPAGEFNAWLLQTAVTAESSEGTVSVIDYSWFVPGVGRAAEIVSQPNESKMPFSTARAFYRLKNHS